MEIAFSSFPNDFDEHPLAPTAIEFTVKYLFPRAEIQFTAGDSDDYFPPHHLALEMSVSVVLARSIVMVLRNGVVRRQSFQPDFVIVQETIFRVIYEH